MLAHFEEYNDIVGDNPMNLEATSLAFNAFCSRTNQATSLASRVRRRLGRPHEANGGIIPTNIGLDGKIGSACGGKWYGGVYGWGFTVLDPATRPAHRNSLRGHRLRQRVFPHGRRQVP